MPKNLVLMEVVETQKKNSSLATKHLGVLAPNLKKMWESPWNHHPTDLGSSQISQNLAGFKYLRIFTFWKHFWDTFGMMAPNHGKFWGVAKSQRPRTSSSSRSPCVAAVLGSTGGAAMASLQRMPRGWCSGSAFGWAKFAWKRDLGSSWIYIPFIHWLVVVVLSCLDRFGCTSDCEMCIYLFDQNQLGVTSN